MAKTFGANKPIVLGHSLGGALAYVCAVDIHLATKNPNIRVLTIGSPRPGNKDFANYFNNKGLLLAEYPNDLSLYYSSYSLNIKYSKWLLEHGASVYQSDPICQHVTRC